MEGGISNRSSPEPGRAHEHIPSPDLKVTSLILMISQDTRSGETSGGSHSKEEDLKVSNDVFLSHYNIEVKSERGGK